MLLLLKDRHQVDPPAVYLLVDKIEGQRKSFGMNLKSYTWKISVDELNNASRRSAAAIADCDHNEVERAGTWP
jgi:hypothetical protein